MIPLWDFAGRAPPTRRPAAMDPRWPVHPPGQTRDYTVDASILLASAGDTLSASIVAVEGVDLVSFVVAGGRVTVLLTGGEAGGEASVDLTLTTASGRIVSRMIRLHIASV